CILDHLKFVVHAPRRVVQREKTSSFSSCLCVPSCPLWLKRFFGIPRVGAAIPPAAARKFSPCPPRSGDNTAGRADCREGNPCRRLSSRDRAHTRSLCRSRLASSA